MPRTTFGSFVMSKRNLKPPSGFADSFGRFIRSTYANPTNSISSGTFMQELGIANTGREGFGERTFRLSLRLGW
jgi:hypothetical protein